MEKKYFEQLQDTVYREVLPNGLTVYIVPKEDFHKTFATFTTNYGSIDNHFVPIGKKEPVAVPDGIAHFLEHKMFEDENGDVFQTFGEQGASANAFTSFTRTAYLFSSTQSVDQNIETLLDFVQHPYFTEESVEKEKGIIEQEIRMYDDNPDWQLFFRLLRNMYHKHPVQIDIAGTAESIQEITKDDLYECYNTFYHPSNMMFFVAGDADPEHLLELIKTNQERKTFKNPEKIDRLYEAEPEGVVTPRTVTPMSVNTPKCMVGFKHSPSDKKGTDLLRYDLSMELLLELMFGAGSDAYESLYEEGLIDDSFAADFSAERSFAFTAIGGDTADPDALEKRILEVINQTKSSGIINDQLERIRKKKIGSFLKQLNSPEFIANQYTRFAFLDIHLFEILPLLEDIKADELMELLQTHFQSSQCTVSQIVKKAD